MDSEQDTILSEEEIQTQEAANRREVMARPEADGPDSPPRNEGGVDLAYCSMIATGIAHLLASVPSEMETGEDDMVQMSGAQLRHMASQISIVAKSLPFYERRYNQLDIDHHNGQIAAWLLDDEGGAEVSGDTVTLDTEGWNMVLEILRGESK